MRGSDVKAVLKEHGINIADLSRKMGMRYPQQLHALLRSSDLNSSRVSEISKFTGISISEPTESNPKATYGQDDLNLRVVSDVELTLGKESDQDKLDKLKEEICSVIDRFYNRV